MKVAIIGGGSIGLLFSYYINIHHDCILFVRNERQREILTEKGLTLIKEEQSYSTPICVKMIEEWEREEVDLSIICVKQYDLELLIPTLSKLNHPVLFVQNGMSHLYLLESLPNPHILIGSVEHGAYRLNEHTVIHTGVNKTLVSIYRGCHQGFLESFHQPFQDIFPFYYEENYLEMLQKKLVVNAVVNPLTALLKVKNGRLLENKQFEQIVRQLFEEISDILSLDRKKDSYFHNVIQVITKTGENQSSMLKDLAHGSQTEVDAILGYLLKEAEKAHKQVPLIYFLYSCVKGLEVEGGGR